MNTIGTIIDTSGCAPKGNTGGGLAHNSPRDSQPQTEAGRKIFDKLSNAIEDTKKNFPLYKISKWAAKAEKLLAKGDIEALQKLSGSIDKVLDKATTASWGNSVVSAGLALAYAIKEVFLPTNIIDVIPVGKIASKGKKALSAIKAAEKSKAARKRARGVHVKGKAKGPCDHLKKGNGKGKYRGGAHSGTNKPLNDGLDSHHMPAKATSPLGKDDGPAIQMEPSDHGITMSNGSKTKSIDYRDKLEGLIKEGKWAEAMRIEVKDVRRVAKKTGKPKKYTEAIREMAAYFHCLKKNGLLK